MNATITTTDMFRLKFRSETYTFNFFRGSWERRFGNLEAYACLVADAPQWRSYVTGHCKPSQAVAA